MRTLYTAACLALCSTSALAADFGIGVSAKSDDAWIYVPIEINKTYRIEPSVRYVSSEQTQFYDGISWDSRTKRTSDSMEIGVGVFRLAKIAESAQIYYGLRAAYVDVESTVTIVSDYTLTLTRTRDKTSLDGYRIGPAFGFEYLFGQHFSIGGEANYTFLDVEGETKSSISPARTKIDQKSNGTETQLILRYRF